MGWGELHVPKPQVRLDDDVAEVLTRAAERGGHSLSAEANVALRRALGMRPQGAAKPAPAAASAPRSACRHPINRRVAGRCMACLATVR